MRSLLAVSLFAFATGCGHAAMPAQDVAQAEASLRAAEEVGSAKIPRAALHVKMAKDQLEVAKRHIARDEIELAQEALRRSTLDAELAVALAKENATRRQATVAGQSADAMRTGAP
jgi:hypothetical protein